MSSILDLPINQLNQKRLKIVLIKQSILSLPCFRKYDIECISSSAPTITQSLSDPDALSGPSDFSQTFDASDGVLSGIPYECAIRTTVNGVLSAKSNPAVFVTPDSGMNCVE